MSVFVAFACCVMSSVLSYDFKPLDNTKPSDFWLPVDNPIPEDYVSAPRFPVVPTPGPIAMDILEQLYPAGTVKPTSIWQKNLWGFPFNDFGPNHWGAIYPYPYGVSPKTGNINFVYPGKPVNESGNSRMVYGVVNADTVPGAVYPWMTMSAAYDFGILLPGLTPQLVELKPLHVTLRYVDAHNKTKCTLYIVKGSPFVSLECTDATLSIGSKEHSIPPIIAINKQPPGLTVNCTSCVFETAQGPAHPQGALWHVYFDKQVELQFPQDPMQSINLTSTYTGVVKIACGEENDALGALLDTYQHSYVTGGDIDYFSSDDGTTGGMTFNWRVKGDGKTLMLALPHHKDIISGVKVQSQKGVWWSTKGRMVAVEGKQWTVNYNYTQVGFGDTKAVSDDYKADLSAQLSFDYGLLVKQCPGDDISQGVPGYESMELYAYVRDLNQYTELAIVAEALGQRDIAVNLTVKMLSCMQNVLKPTTKAPHPCEPPVNNTQTCVRTLLDMFYDKKWGGLVTGWYQRFAEHYCECDRGSATACEGRNYCDNPTGYSAFSNYGNPFYNDHHFQYGYIVKSLAWALYFQSSKGANLSLTATETANITKQALLFARDYANPSPDADTYFPFLRHKDLFDGHSWAEGYDYSGRVQTWLNQQSSGEAINSYYAIYLLGLALNNTNVKQLGQLLLASEQQSIRTYTHLTNTTEDDAVYFGGITNVTRCLSIIIGNGATGATYYGPNYLFECGITMLPVSAVTQEWIDRSWAYDTYEWLQEHMKKGGLCAYPNPVNTTANICGGSYGPSWWGNEWACCPTDQGYPDNQWKFYPDWFPYMYYLLALKDQDKAWDKLKLKDLTTPNPPNQPFPYINSVGGVVGYPQDLRRAVLLFAVATIPQQ